MSRAHVERLAPELSPWLEDVPDACALVRVEDRWDRFLDGTATRRWTVDFAREEGATRAPALARALLPLLRRRGLRHVDRDEELERDVLVQGASTVRIWPAACLLLDAGCESLRVDLSRPWARDPMPVDVGPAFAELARLLALEDPLDVTREVVFDLDELDRERGGRVSAAYAAVEDAAARVEAAGFDAKGRWSGRVGDAHLSASVRIGDARLTLELESDRGG